MFHKQTYNVRMRKGEDSPRFATLRHNDIQQTLVLPSHVDTVKFRAIAGIGEGPTVVIEDTLLAPSPGPYTLVSEVVLSTPVQGPGYVNDPVGANFSHVVEWDSLSNDKYDGLRVYREEYEIDCRVAGTSALGFQCSRILLVYNISMVSTMGPITT